MTAIRGIDDLQRKLGTSIPRAVIRDVAVAMENQADRLVNEMRRVVPRDQGELARSINYTWGDAPSGSITIGSVRGNEYGRIRITIYAGDETTRVPARGGLGSIQNAILQEFGTVRGTPASGFFYPTYQRKRRGARNAMTRAATKAIKEAFANG